VADDKAPLDALYDLMSTLCHDLSLGRHGGADALFELTREGVYPERIVSLAESFGMMLVKVEAREFHLEETIRELKRRNLELEEARGRLARENLGLKQSLGRIYSPKRIVGHGPAMQDIFDQIRRVADTPVNVLITGETGTGKEIIAKAVHFNSSRRQGPFVAVNCSAIPETLLESELFGIEAGVATGVRHRVGMVERATGGTLFLDEIGDLSLPGQAKILRMLEEREITRVGGVRSIAVDVRIVAATNKNLKAETAAGNFREDLYYRLNVVHLRLPPLRERAEDIPVLIKTFLDQHTRAMQRPAMSMSRAALEMLLRYSWPGNIRELDNEVERLVALAYSDRIEPDTLSARIREHQPADHPAGEDHPEGRALSSQSLPPGLPPGLASLPENLEAAERALILRALAATGWKRMETAKRLGITRQGLCKKMKRFEISK
jgi:DNA-binding NtrC family response regulator